MELAGSRHTVGALIITYTILGVPYDKYSIMGALIITYTILGVPYDKYSIMGAFN